MVRLSLVASAAWLTLANGVLGVWLDCGKAQYDPDHYVCYSNQFLCPVIAGESLKYCNGACYSNFMYQCVGNVLTLLPALDTYTPFTLTVSNPTLPIDGWDVNAGGSLLYIGGVTKSYCPEGFIGPAKCPPGNITVLRVSEYGSSRAGMDVTVPGGQAIYLDPFWSVAYERAHSAYVPPGSIKTGFAAYQGGGFVNLNGNGAGWVACPPEASAEGDDNVWGLVGKNDTNAEGLKDCTSVNLKVHELPRGQPTNAWQYA